MQAPEIELKFPVVDPKSFRRKVEELGFRLETERTFERNTLYDTPDRDLRERGQILRLRSYGERCTVTHKRKTGTSDARYKTRIETETTVGDCDALAEVFKQLGCDPVFHYEKFRTEWAYGETGGHLVLDETPVGIWAELEGDPAWIDAMLDGLGIPAGDTTTASYGKLFLAWKERSGSPAENMTFAETESVVSR
jgi:adenylate cyclase class 2